jgi:hypothetical protein
MAKSNFVVTKRGAEVAGEIFRTGLFQAGDLPQLEQTMSRIGRLATTYTQIQELWCNEEMSDARRARVERKEARLERAMLRIAGELPQASTGPCKVIFGGDPRGYSVKVQVPGAPHTGNTFGLAGEFGI